MRATCRKLCNNANNAIKTTMFSFSEIQSNTIDDSERTNAQIVPRSLVMLAFVIYHLALFLCNWPQIQSKMYPNVSLLAFGMCQLLSGELCWVKNFQCYILM